MKQQTADLLRHLQRSGEWAYFWTLPDKKTTWFEVNHRIPEPPKSDHVYFGIHPTINKKENGRGSLDIIAAINCLFAEFDLKDFQNEQALTDHIEALAIPPSVVINSGGGKHAYWLLDQPYLLIDEDTRNNAASIQSLWVKYVGGDPGSKDLARVLRLPGTMNHKYNPPRPVLIESCDLKRTYTIEQLSAILPLEPPPPEFIANPIVMDPGQAGVYWLNRAIKEAAPGNRNEKGFWMGCQLRDAGLSEAEVKNILLDYQAQVTTGENPYTKDEAIATAAEVFSKTPRRPAGRLEKTNMDEQTTIETVKELGGIPAEAPKPAETIEIKIPERPERKTSYTMAELYDTDFPEPNWAIPGLIPEGLDILGGRPKIGKSWLLMQVAHAISTGGRFFGQEVKQGNVLYIAFEDSKRRIKDRANIQGIPHDAAIEWRFEWQALQGPGMADLLIAIGRHDLRAVIIDTMARGIPGIDPQKDLATIQRVYSEMQTIALENGIAFLTSDHCRKMGGYDRDPIDDIINTTSKTAIADSVLALYKTHGKTEANLMGRGRDFEDINLLIEWDPITCSWQSLGDAEEAITSQNDAQVLEGINELLESGDLPTVTEMTKNMELGRASIFRSIKNLIDKGKITKGAKQGRLQPYYPVGYTREEQDEIPF